MEQLTFWFFDTQRTSDVWGLSIDDIVAAAPQFSIYQLKYPIIWLTKTNPFILESDEDDNNEF